MVEKESAQWERLLRQFKETLAKRIWALPTISEKEKEIVYRECLGDLDEFESHIREINNQIASKQQVFEEENTLLRSLMGVEDNDRTAKTLSMGHDLSSLKKKNEDLSEQLREANKRLKDLEDENTELRTHIRENEGKTEQVYLEQTRIREADIKAFSESHQGLKNQLQDLEIRLKNLRALFTETNEKMLIEKQEDISLLQKKLLSEMEEALRHKQELLWAEEEMFAKGVAHKVRTALVSAQGQLFLTLERLGLMNTDSKPESFWKARLRLMMEGGEELAENFISAQSQLQAVTETLDDYLHLTHRRDVKKKAISIKSVINKQLAELSVERLPNLKIEFLSDDPMPDIEADEELLSFCFRHLIQNAIESLPHESGQVTISLKNNRDKAQAEVYIQDQGSGIPEHLRDRLFEPFFTTKERRQGLNLSRCKRYIELHGGALFLLRTDGSGTIFQINFPLKKA